MSAARVLLIIGVWAVVAGCAVGREMEGDGEASPRIGQNTPSSPLRASAAATEPGRSAPLIESGCEEATRPALDDEDYLTFGAGPPQDGFRLRDLRETGADEARDDGFEATVPDLSDGAEVQFVGRTSSDLYTHLSADAIGEGDTFGNLMARRGAQVIEYPGRAENLDKIKAAFEGEEQKGKAALVAIGPHPGLVTRYAHEVLPGVRPYSVFWRAGDTLWEINAGVDDPAAVIDMARSMECP